MKENEMSEPTDMSLNEFYTAILASAMHEVEEDGKVFAMAGTKKILAEISGRQLVLPKDELLRFPSEENVFFHPLSEQMTRGESTVFRWFRRLAVLKLNTTMSIIGHALLKLLERPELQRQMKPEHHEVLKGIVDCDKDSATNWTKMALFPIETSPVRTDAWNIDIFLKRGGKYKDKNFRRVAVTSFPSYEFISEGNKFKKGSGADEKTLFRVKDYAMYKQVVAAIFPKVLEPNTEEYNTGYDGTGAPYLITFLRAYKQIADHLNGIIDLFKTYFEAADLTSLESQKLECPWGDLVTLPENEIALTKLIRCVPALKGNIGSIEGKEDDNLEPYEKSAAPAKETRKEVKKETVAAPTIAEEKPKIVSDPSMTDEHRRLQEEAMLKRQAFLEEQKREAERLERRREEDRRYEREREERDREERDRRERERDSRAEEYTRDRRDDRDYDRRDRDHRDEREVEAAPGKTSFASILSRNRAIAETRSMEEERDYDRRDRRGTRDYGRGRDDRDYDRRDRDRDYRDRDRRDYRDRDRDYRGRDDRDYDRRDRDRDYRDRDRRDSRRFR